jgi:hypothetical protein
MNVEIGTEAAQFPEKEYIYAIFLAVWSHCCVPPLIQSRQLGYQKWSPMLLLTTISSPAGTTLQMIGLARKGRVL